MDDCALYLSPKILIAMKNITTEYVSALSNSSSSSNGSDDSAQPMDKVQPTRGGTGGGVGGVAGEGGGADRYRYTITNDSNAPIWYGQYGTSEAWVLMPSTTTSYSVKELLQITPPIHRTTLHKGTRTWLAVAG